MEVTRRYKANDNSITGRTLAKSLLSNKLSHCYQTIAWTASFPSLKVLVQITEDHVEQLPVKELQPKMSSVTKRMFWLGFFGLEAVETDSG